MPLTSASTLVGFPDAKSTGVPDGVTLTASGDVNVTTPGTVIDALDVKGTIWVMAPNVTIQNSRITSTDWTGIWIKPGITGTVVKDNEILNVGSSKDGANGIFGSGTFLRNDIHDVENGINVSGSSLIQDNYIHDMHAPNVRAGTVWGGPHYDGIEINGGVSGVDIRHNTIINENGQTSAVMINNDFGPVSDIQVDGNYLAGGGYTLYSDGSFSSTDKISGVEFTNNKLGQGYWGYYYFKGNTPVLSSNDEVGTEWPTPVSTDGTPVPQPTPTIAMFSTDSGIVGDSITNDDTLTLSGTAAANSTVKVLEGTTQVGQTTANGSGAWSVTTSALPDGSHSFTATATSGGTTSGSSSPLTVRVDTVAPSAPTIASFSSDTGTVGDGITSDNTLMLTGAAAANSAVKVYDEGALLGTVTANGSGAWSYTTGPLPNGTHSFTATATDVAGNLSAASTALAVTVIPSSGDTVAPSAPTIAGFSTDSGIGGDRITNDRTLTLTGSAEANSSVAVYDGTKLLGTASANGSGAWSYTTDALSEAGHNFTAKATDAAGNMSAASSVMSITVDGIAPTKPVIAAFSTDTGTVGDGITNDHTLTLTGTAEASSSVAVYDGDALLGTVTANGSGAWNYSTGALADASYNFTARATDAAGNTSVASSILAITVDSDGSGPAPTPTTGTSGNDVLEGTNGADVLMGYAGNDTYTVNSTADQVVELANEGIDKVESTISYTLAGNVENLQLMGNAQINGAGNDLNNTIIGNDVSNTIRGNAGNDTLNGWGGKDTFFGDSGNDVFQFSSQFSADGDKVMDFVHGVDKLDFSKIDASASWSGDQAFTFDGYDDGGSNRHLWAVEDQAAGVTHVYGKTGNFQFQVDLQGLHLDLTTSDFIL